MLRSWERGRPFLLVLSCLACAGARPGGKQAAVVDPAAVSAAQESAPQPPAVREFTERVKDYAAFHRRLELALPPLKEVNDAGQIEKRCKALAAAIRAARPNAKQGEIFVASVVPHFRTLVKSDLKNREPPEKAAVFEEVPPVELRPNDDYPQRAPLATVPPMLLATLPPLPEEVEYRFVGRDLILRDVKANLIVDFIPGLLAGPR